MVHKFPVCPYTMLQENIPRGVEREQEAGTGTRGAAQLRVLMVSCRLGLRRTGFLPLAAVMSACTAASQLSVITAAGTWQEVTNFIYMS